MEYTLSRVADMVHIERGGEHLGMMPQALWGMLKMEKTGLEQRISELKAGDALLERIIEVLAGHATNCPPEPVICMRETDTESDTHETCIACRIAWAATKAQAQPDQQPEPETKEKGE